MIHTERMLTLTCINRQWLQNRLWICIF